MEQILDFLSMGGYAVFVWPAIGLTLGVLIWIAWASLTSLKRTQKELKALESLGLERRRGRDKPR